MFANGRVHKLPLYQEDKRTASRSRADSVRRSSLHTWLESEAGRAWVAEKKLRRE